MSPRDFIVFPVASLIAWTFAVGMRFLVLNVVSVRRRSVNPVIYKTFGEDAMPRPNLLAMKNVSNLLEAPVFFYVLAVFLYMSDSVDRFYLFLAWAYVAARMVHSMIHMTYNHVLHRLAAFMFSNVLLWVAWGRFVIQAWQRIS